MRNKLKCLFCLFLISLFPVSLGAQIGGNFKGPPEDIHTKISPGAKKLLEKVYSDLNGESLHDHHVHVVGVDEKQGTTVNPKMLTPLHPMHYLKTKIYLSAAGVDEIKEGNAQYIQRLLKLIRGNPNMGKFHILAFDHYYRPNGTINYEKSEFYVSNEYMFSLYQQYPNIFVPVISVHPYRKDAISELEKWGKEGVKWIKWLPNAQGIDASNANIDEYYQTMKKYNMVLLTHVGEEQAVEAKEDQKLGNPLSFRRPLDMGVKIVMAHCASLGENEDLDRIDKPAINSFDLFIRLLKEPKYEKLLYGEISAMTQFNRLPKPLLTLLEHPELHHRLVNGSDYPLPAINILIQTRSLVKYGMLSKEERGYLNEIYQYNPLIFDYALKRTIRHPQTGEKLNKEIFTRKVVN